MPDPQSRRPVSVIAAIVRSANAVPPSWQPSSAPQSPFHLRRSYPANRSLPVVRFSRPRPNDIRRAARPPHRSGSFVAAVPPHLPATALRSRPSRTPLPAHPKLDTPNSLPAPPTHPTHTRHARHTRPRPQPHASPHATRPAGHEKSRPGRDGLFHRIENRRDQ